MNEALALAAMLLAVDTGESLRHHVPPEKVCEQQHRVMGEYLDSLREYRCRLRYLVGQRGENEELPWDTDHHGYSYQPWHKDYPAVVQAIADVDAEICRVEKGRDVWYALWWVAWRNDGAPPRVRRQWADDVIRSIGPARWTRQEWPALAPPR